MARASRALAQDPGDKRPGEQQQNDEAPELGERETPERSLRMITDAIGPDPRQSLPRLAGREPAIEVGAEVRGDSRQVECVPGLTDDGSCRTSREPPELVFSRRPGPLGAHGSRPRAFAGTRDSDGL